MLLIPELWGMVLCLFSSMNTRVRWSLTLLSMKTYKPRTTRFIQAHTLHAEPFHMGSFAQKFRKSNREAGCERPIRDKSATLLINPVRETWGRLWQLGQSHHPSQEQGRPSPRHRAPPWGWLWAEDGSGHEPVGGSTLARSMAKQGRAVENWKLAFCSIARAGSDGYEGLTQYAGLLVAQFLILVWCASHVGISVSEYGGGVSLLRNWILFARWSQHFLSCYSFPKEWLWWDIMQHVLHKCSRDIYISKEDIEIIPT